MKSVKSISRSRYKTKNSFENVSKKEKRKSRNKKSKLRAYTRKLFRLTRDKKFSYPLLVVFDIDETVIQFLNKNAYKYFKNMDEKMKIDLTKNILFKDIEDKEQCILFRPGLEDFFNYVEKHKEYIKIALWTYSENEYAKTMKEELIEKYNLDEDIFLFTWGYEDMYEDDDSIEYPKDLELIWNDDKRHELQEEYNGESDEKRFGNVYNKFNTIFLDDRYGNVKHEKNRRNSILVQGFEPFGYTKVREPITKKLLKIAKGDNILSKLIEILENIKKDHEGCTEEEKCDALKAEYIFEPSKLERKNLNHYLKEYNDDIKLITLGDIENAFSIVKGGGRH
tara:strand:- start:518 stop:1531 length:1014 start_codon:yes stop_codon:yes gene_type:complete